MSQPNIFYNFTSENFDSRKTKIEFIILHYTETKDLSDALDLLTDKRRKVSAHYLIDIDGTIYNLVSETKRAWHAGVSMWQGLEDINSRSLGIEIVNQGEKKSNYYPDLQIKALIALIKYLMKKYKIDSNNILGHSDIAPLRKIDPGKYFPWKKLSENMIGLWSNYNEIDIPLENNEVKLLLKNLKKIGYPLIDLDTKSKNNSKIIDAFHRHFMPYKVGEEPTITTLEISIKLIKLKNT
tara:strand:+ start:991 stop:1707 length:717 start_codon:yes stop_codon:yes gene_type:complete